MLNHTDRYLAASFALFCFIAAQAFQSVALTYWIPAGQSPQENLTLYLLPINELRAALVGIGILLLAIPYLVTALQYFPIDPIFSLLGFVSGTGFIAAEIAQRSIDFFLVARWAREMGSTSAISQDVLLQRYELWNDITTAWYFPLLLAHLVASCCFFRVTWIDWDRGVWFRLAPCAFFLNALRLVARMLSMFAGQTWLDSLNKTLYSPLVCIVNVLLIAWFLNLHRQQSETL